MLPDEIPLDEDLTQQSNDDAPPVFQLVPATELTRHPTPINWLIRDYLQAQAMIEIFGAPGAGKSFIALDMAFCIATGIKWHNRKVKQGIVVYLAGEGFHGLGQRIKALELHHQQPAKNLIISKQPASLTDQENALWVADAVHQYKPALIVVDTISRNFGAGDENSTRDMAAFINHLDLYIKGEAAVLLVHHSGHGDKNRARGSSVLNAAVDVEYSVTKDGNTLNLCNTKAKDFEPPKPLAFQMMPIELDWRNDEGQPVKSVVLNETEFKSSQPSKPRLSGRNEAILAALYRAIDQHGVKPDKDITERFGGFGITSGRRVVHIDHWRKEALMVIDVDSGERESANKRMAFSRAKDALLKNHVQTMNGYWWVIHD